jgi:membrane peptidoglycan carboxypeptidase
MARRKLYNPLMPATTDIIRQRQARRAAARQGARRAQRNLASFALTLAIGALLSVAAVAGALAGVYAYYTRDLPSAESLQAAFNPISSQFFQTTQIYDRTDTHLLYEVIDPRGGDRQYLTYNQIPPSVISATVALEDKTFFTNPGYDVIGITRALISNLRGDTIQGGSSITQQLVKNTLIPIEQRSERSYSRKIREILLSAEITRRYSKPQILEWYLNTNFYGNLAYGIDAASLVYFGKHATDLSLAEAAPGPTTRSRRSAGSRSSLTPCSARASLPPSRPSKRARPRSPSSRPRAVSTSRRRTSRSTYASSWSTCSAKTWWIAAACTW